ncbi:MAG: enoyl-CoA hydratase-related protein [Acidimicrobiales bacterium]
MAVERRDDGVAVVTVQNGKVNALSSEVLRQLLATAESLTSDPPGAVVITGGERIFAAGADIAEFDGPEEAKVVGDLFLRSLTAVADIPRATFAAVNGFALGGGCELAIACDFRIVSDRAKFGQPEVLLGIIPGGGGTQRLARLIGPSRTKDLVFSGRQIAAAEALAMGLVDEIVAPPAVIPRAVERAAELAPAPCWPGAGQAGRRSRSRHHPDRGLDPAAALRPGLGRGRPMRCGLLPTARPGKGDLPGAVTPRNRTCRVAVLGQRQPRQLRCGHVDGRRQRTADPLRGQRWCRPGPAVQPWLPDGSHHVRPPGAGPRGRTG